MSTMTNILVKDDASTPVESTLVPVTDTPVSYWRARASGVPVDGQVQVWMSEEPVRGGEAVKRTIKLEVPVMETLGASGTSAGYVAAQKVAFRNTAFITSFVNRRSTPQQAADLLRMVLAIGTGANATSGTGVVNTVTGNAFINATNPGIDFMVNGTRPS